MNTVQIAVPDELADRSATLELRLAETELGNDIDADALQVLRHDTDDWGALETDVEHDDEGVVLSVETPGFSYFAAAALAPPDPEITAPETVVAGEDVELSGANSTDRYGEVTAYEWIIDGTGYEGATVTTSVDEPGEVTVTLTVENTDGLPETTETTIEEVASDGDAADDGVPGFGFVAVAATTGLLASGYVAMKRLRD